MLISGQWLNLRHRGALGDLLKDLISGSSNSGSWVLNREDPGLLKSLDVLTSEQASKVPVSGGSSIAGTSIICAMDSGYSTGGAGR